MTQIWQTSINDRMNYTALLTEKLDLLNPLNLMKKGYTLTYQQNKLIMKASDVQLEKALKVIYYDGEVETMPVKKNQRKEG